MSRVPRLLSGHHDQSLSLSAPEAYLLSRVDAMLDEDDLALVTGMTPRQVAGALDRLAALGAVEMVAGQPPGGGPSQPPGPRSQGARSASAPPATIPPSWTRPWRSSWTASGASSTSSTASTS